jgi:hypothetical protein
MKPSNFIKIHLKEISDIGLPDHQFVVHEDQSFQHLALPAMANGLCKPFRLWHRSQLSNQPKKAKYNNPQRTTSYALTNHSLESNSVQIFGTVIPHDVRSRPRTGRRPILNVVDLSPAAVSSVLVLPLPVDTSHHSGAREDSSYGDLFAFPPCFKQNSEILNI